MTPLIHAFFDRNTLLYTLHFFKQIWANDYLRKNKDVRKLHLFQ